MSKGITQIISPYSGPSVSRMAKDTGRVAIHARLTGTNGRGDEKIGEEGTISVYLEVNQYGLIALDVKEASHASADRDLFYAQVAIDRSEPSGVRVRRETVPPARPDGCLSLTAAQVEAIRAALATIDNTNITALQSERAAFYGAVDTIRALLP